MPIRNLNPQASLDAQKAKLAQEASELELRLKAINEERDRIKIEEDLRVEAEKKLAPYIILIKDVVNTTIVAESPYHPQIIEMWRNVPGRFFCGGNVNKFPIDNWKQFEKSFNDAKVFLPNLEIQYHNGAKETIENITTAPDLKITFEQLTNRFLFEEKYYLSALRQLTGIQHSRKTDSYYFPRSEAIHLSKWINHQVTENKLKIEWSEEALSVFEKELQRHETLDKLALAEDCELDIEFLDKSVKPKPFQKVGIRLAEATGYRCIFGHQMGLGKTIMAIGAVELLKRELKRQPRVLVVCPAPLKANWSREIHKLTGESAFTLRGRNADRFTVESLLLRKDNWYIINYDILGYSFEADKQHETESGKILRHDIKMVYPWVDFLNFSGFDLIILDEAHKIKSEDAKRAKAALLLECERIIPMTGTPVLNRPGEIFNMLHLVAPEKFSNRDEFLRVNTYNNVEVRNVERLRETLKPILFRKTKKEVMKDLPPINRVWDWQELSESGKKHYQKALEGVYEVLAMWNPNEAGMEKDITNILVQIQRLKQVCSLDKVERVADLAVEMSDSDIDAGNLGKVIIFSQYKAVVEAIAKRLGHESVIYDGDIPQNKRMPIVDQFVGNPKVKFFVATPQTASEGLNLQIANYVIFADLLWTPASHQQAEERAYGRLADPHPIDAYYVVLEGTIEETIIKILERKLKMIESMVEGLDSERGTSSMANELIATLKREMFRR